MLCCEADVGVRAVEVQDPLRAQARLWAAFDQALRETNHQRLEANNHNLGPPDLWVKKHCILDQARRPAILRSNAAK